MADLRVRDPSRARVRDAVRWALYLVLSHSIVPSAWTQVADADTSTAAGEEIDYGGRFADDAELSTSRAALVTLAPMDGVELGLSIGGFANFTCNQDLVGTVGSGSVLLPRTIASGSTPQFNTSVRGSRLNFDARGTFGAKARAYRIFVEVGFGGTFGDELATNNDGLALRHAFGNVGDFYLGQYWSLLTDLRSYPESIDPFAPAGKIFVRQPGLHYAPWLRGGPGDGLRVAIGLENPEADLSWAPRASAGLAPPQTNDPAPDVLLYVHLDREGGHLQLVGLLRRLSAEGRRAVSTAGASLTASIDLPALSDGARATFAVAGGTGLARYFADLRGLGYDGVLDPDGDEIDALAAAGGYLTVQHWWSREWRSSLAAGAVGVAPPDITPSGDGTPEDRVVRVRSALVNLFHSASPSLTFGAEAALAEAIRRAGSGAVDRNVALRVSFLARFSF